MINMYLSAVCPAVWLDGTFISQWIYYIKKKSTLEGECSVLCRKHCKILSVGMCPCLLLLFSFFLFYVLSLCHNSGMALEHLKHAIKLSFHLAVQVPVIY